MIDIERLAAEAEAGYDLSKAQSQRIVLPTAVRARQEADRVLTLEKAARDATLRRLYLHHLDTGQPNREQRRKLSRALGIPCPAVSPTPRGEQ